MFKLNGKPITIDRDLTIGDITYPAGSLRDLALRAALGIIEEPDPVRPDERYYYVTDNDDGSLTATPKPLDVVRGLKLEEIASNRYAREVGGVALPGGMKIKTDRESQSLIASALMRVQRNQALQIDWKGENGWVRLDKAAVESIADAVGNHVQACFTAERVKTDALMALKSFNAIIAFDTAVE